MIHLLASGVYWSGFVKDLLCLPRPLSPPLRRITMSGSAAMEYGFPSTHSTNAVSVTVYALLQLRAGVLLPAAEPAAHLAAQVLLWWYVLSIVLGRLYCGMHGFLDVLGGGALGALLAVVEARYGAALDAQLYAPPSSLMSSPSSSSLRLSLLSSAWLPLLVVLAVCVLVRVHPEPADDCPCFDDSLAFAGVVIGAECGAWHYARSGWAWDRPGPATVPFDLRQLGWARAALRVVVGVAIVVAWRAAAKPALLRHLPPLFRVIERVGLSLPRRFFVPASYVSFVSFSNPFLTFHLLFFEPPPPLPPIYVFPLSHLHSSSSHLPSSP